MRAHDFINEGYYGGDAAKYPYGRGIRRGDTVRNVDTDETFVVHAVEGSKILLDNGEVVTPRDKYVVVHPLKKLDELYDPERKYTGDGKPPPPPPPSKRGGPDWEGDGDKQLWREFFTLMRERLIERDFKILYPRNTGESALLLDANWPASMRAEQHLGAMRIWFDINPDSTATLHILAWKPGMLPEKPTTVINPEVEPWENRKLRIRITDFEFALRKIATIQQVIISNRTKPTNESMLTEGATDILYHYTTPYNASKILRDGEFKLASSVGVPGEAQYAPKGYHYFLSTTRSRMGDYHRYKTNGATMFVLDGRWLGQRYRVKPIDYWEQSWVHAGIGRTRESEDRVFSKNNTIPLTPVTAVHVFVEQNTPDTTPGNLVIERGRWNEVQQIVKYCSERNIPVYTYYDVRSWRTQNTARAVDPSTMPELTTAHDVKTRTGDDQYLRRWLELVEKQPDEPLSREGDRARYMLKYYKYDVSGQLSADFHNARKPTAGSDYQSLVKIIDYMKRNRLLKLSDLIEHLYNKWNTEQ